MPYEKISVEVENKYNASEFCCLITPFSPCPDTKLALCKIDRVINAMSKCLQNQDCYLTDKCV